MATYTRITKEDKEYWTNGNGLVIIQGLRRDGYTIVEIANKINVNPDTIYEWKKKYPDFAESLRIGKEEADYFVESALMEQIQRGNMTGIIFYLKNRNPKKWCRENTNENESVEDLSPLAKLLGLNVSKINNPDEEDEEDGESNTDNSMGAV